MKSNFFLKKTPTFSQAVRVRRVVLRGRRQPGCADIRRGDKPVVGGGGDIHKEKGLVKTTFKNVLHSFLPIFFGKDCGNTHFEHLPSSLMSKPNLDLIGFFKMSQKASFPD